MTLDAKYKTGVVWQDLQHKQLIDLFKRLKEAHINKTEKNLYRYSIEFLAMFVKYYFAMEEEYMGKYDYPDKDVHYKEHQNFVKEVKEFRSRNNEYSRSGSEELLTLFDTWIYSHILENDKKLGEFIISFETENGKIINSVENNQQKERKLKPCRKCGKTVSNNDLTCLNCGCKEPYNSTISPLTIFLLCFIFFLLIFIFIDQLSF